jgi:hypothetical protein
MKLFLLVLASIGATSALADQALLSKDMGVTPSKEIAEAEITPGRWMEDLVVAPIPISNPTVGSGLAVVVMPFYKLGPGSPLSNTALAAGYTSSGSWGVGAAQSTRLRGDVARIDGTLAYAEVHYRFYGTGAAAGTNGTSIPIVQKGFVFSPEILFQVGGRAFVGLRYRGMQIETAPEGSAGLLPPQIAAVLPGSISIASSGFGPKATFDTRDHDMSPSSGVLAELRTNFADEAFGSDFDYQTYELAGNLYRRAGPGVLALRAFACRASDRTPLFDLCFFGSGSDLRGYEAGRYRDQAMVAAQAEYRFPLAGRWGGVVFGGWGKVAPSFGEMGEEPDLPSIGVGVRWMAAQKARVNLSVDLARGRDDTSLYVYVKESF